MKVQYGIALAVLLLCGCEAGTASDKRPVSETGGQQEQGAPEEHQNASSDSFWIIPPSMDLDHVFELEAWPFILGTQVEITGAPQQWDNNTTEHEASYPDTPYSADSITVVKDGRYAIMNYSGQFLYPFSYRADETYFPEDYSPVQYHPITGFIVFTNEGFGYVYTADFTSRVYGRAGGIGGDAPAAHVRNGKAMIMDWKTNQEIPYTNTTGKRNLLLVLNEKDEITGGMCMDTDSNLFCEFEGYSSNFINGMITVNDYDAYDRRPHFGFVRCDDGKAITGLIYDQVKYFEEGFAPVMKDGHWAFIDTDGNTVTDFLFEDASVVYDGKAFVCVDGKYGILDLQAVKKSGRTLSSEDCTGTWETITYDVPKKASFDPIGKVTVHVDRLNSRSFPSTYGEKMGKVENGKTYDVYDIYDDTEYTWYRIDENRWIASKEKWCTFVPEE